MSEAKIDATGAAERMRKYRKKNQLKNGLTIAKQQFKRAQLLASGTSEGKKLRQDAAERKSTISNDSDSGSEFDDIVDSDD